MATTTRKFPIANYWKGARPFPLVLVAVILTSINALQVALLTGATGRTGKMVTDMLLEKGFRCNIFCRDVERAQALFPGNSNVEFFQGDLCCQSDIEAAFDKAKPKLTHVIFMAGGEDADYKEVNYKAVAAFAEQAAKCRNMCHFVLISTAWATKPYSIGSLVFNSLYPDSVPMASHYLGEQSLRKAAATNSNMNYVILRATGLNSDENYAKKYPEAASMGLTYQQGDSFDFLGIAGRPGMSRSQLSNAVVTAANVIGRYTTEITGSGTVEWDDSSVYQRLVQDESLVPSENQEDKIYRIHENAVLLLKNAGIILSLGGIALILSFGVVQGLFLLAIVDAVTIFLWRKLLADRRAM